MKRLVVRIRINLLQFMGRNRNSSFTRESKGIITWFTDWLRRKTDVLEESKMTPRYPAWRNCSVKLPTFRILMVASSGVIVYVLLVPVFSVNHQF